MKPIQTKIADALSNKYSDFLSFCSSCGKTYTHELANVDYVAFRVSYGKSREYISEIKSCISNFSEGIKYETKSINGDVVCRETSSDSINNTDNDVIIDTSISLAQLFRVKSDFFTDVSIDCLNLGVRTKRCLRRKNCVTIDELLEITINDLRNIRNLGSKSIDEIIQKTRDFIEKQDVIRIPYESEPIKKKEDDDSINTIPTLAQLFNVDANSFGNVSIDRLNFCVRTKNCFRRKNYTTLKDLLEITMNDLQNIRTLGSKSIDEIVQKTRDFVANQDIIGDFDNREPVKEENEEDINDVASSLAQLFCVNADSFANTSIDRLNFGVRAKGCLNRNKCVTVRDILVKTMNDLMNFRNLGTKTLNEIVEKTKGFVANSDNYGMFPTRENKYLVKEESVALIIDEKLKLVVYDILSAKKYSMMQLSEKQQELAIKVANSMKLIGQISTSMPDKLVRPFIHAYSLKFGKALQKFSLECDNTTVFSDIPVICKKMLEKDFKPELIDEVDRFINWSCFETSEIVSKITSSIKDTMVKNNPRAYDIIKLRAKGMTLEEIGQRYGLTRERVRQITNKGVKLFWNTFNNQKYDLIMLIYAVKNGDAILQFDKIRSILGTRFTSVLWACIKHDSEHGSYHFLKTFNAIEVKTDNNIASNESNISATIDKFIMSLPAVFKLHKKSSLLAEFANNNSIPLELVKDAFKQKYKKTGFFYYRGRITVSFMCEYVLKHCFPAGFKIADSFEGDHFRQCVYEFFGEDAPFITNRALDAKIGEVGILCNRGKYIHPDYLHVNKRIMNAVNKYIEKSTRTVLPYGDIFDALKDILSDTQITNKYLLQGALKKYGCKFSTGRDFVRKANSVTLVDELERFIEERGIVHKSEIFAEFTSISDAGLPQIAARSTNIFSIDNGYYIHASQFDIQPEDYHQLRTFLTQECQEIPINIRSIYDSVLKKFPDFMLRNSLDDKGKLFAALYYMFGNEFSFSRAYIAKLGMKEVTNRSVILKHIEDYDSIEIEDLIDICDENSIHIVSYPNLIQQLYPEYVRINKNTLLKKSLTGITDSIVEDAVKIVLDMLQTNEYINSSQITDYLWFPQVDVDWNSFLLENIIVASGKVNVVYSTGNTLEKPIAIFVSEAYKDDNFTSFLIKILTKEVKAGTFLTKGEMRDWLQEKGLIAGGLPKFLAGSKYFYSDTTGVHCTVDEED